MDARVQVILQEYRNSIIKDVDVDYILEALISSKKLTSVDIENLLSLNTRTEKITKLLDIITRNGLPMLEAFIDSLREPYDWIWKDLRDRIKHIPIKVMKDCSNDILNNGNVPKLPYCYVKRSALEDDLHKRLLRLERNQTLTLHGMSGIGKTSLVVSTLRNNHSLSVDTYNGHIYWIGVGDCKTEDQIMTLQSRLLKKLEQIDNKMNVSTSSMTLGSMTDYSIYVDQDWESNRDKLIETFRKDDYKDALLVIDDPKDRQIVEAFDVGCKILVITQDKTLVDDNPNTFNLNNSFTQEESLQLISCRVGIDIKELPDQAKKMHSICRGNPSYMAMLGGLLADHKEALKHDRKKWNDLIKELRHKSNFFSRINMKNKSEIKLEMFIKSLQSDDLIKAYKSLVVLPDNIKISLEALTVILHMDNLRVKDFMTELRNKSLISEEYNRTLRTYEYEVPDLIMTYLKDTCDRNDLKKMHCNLLKRYRSICSNNKLSNIPNDGYIAYYIGYHISETGNYENMWRLFRELYTDLNFIGNKIRLAGPSDTIADLNRYSSHILEDDSLGVNKEFINKLGKFISSYGYDLHHYPSTDIVQSILQYESSGELYDKAINLIKDDQYKNHVYFQCLSSEDQDHLNYIVMDVGSEFNYLHLWSNFIFIGHNDGTVTLRSIHDYKKFKTFHGDKSLVKFISTNFILPHKMASVHENGTIQVWDINDLIINVHDEDNDNSPESENHFTYVCDTWESYLTFKHESGALQSVHWGRRSDIFLSYTSGNVIIIYDVKNKTYMEINVSEDHLEITCSLLSSDDTLAIIGYTVLNEKKFGISMYCTKTRNSLITITEYDPVLQLASLPDEHRSILVITPKYIQKHKWKKVILNNSEEAKENIIHSKLIELDESSKFEFKMIKVGAKDIIFVTTTDFRILIYSISKSEKLCDLDNHRSIVTMMDYMEYEMSIHLLLTASSSDKFARLWFVDDSQFNLNRVRKTPKFDSKFNLNINTFPMNFLDRTSHMKDSELALRRVKTLGAVNKNSKPSVQKTTSLDRHSLKSFNFLSRQISNDDPIIAVIDIENHIQVFRGNKLITTTDKANSTITNVVLSPCCRYMFYGLENGNVYCFKFKTLNGHVIMEIKEAVNYMEFINATTLVVGGKICGLMIYEILNGDNESNVKMLKRIHNELGSQELLDNIAGKRKNYESKMNGNNRNSVSSTESNDSQIERTSDSGKNLHKYKCSRTVKCVRLPGNGMLSVEIDGSVKLWSVTSTPRLIDVIVHKQNLKLSCVDVQKNHLVICHNNGCFQIYKLVTTDASTLLKAEQISSYTITENIISCAISSDEIVLAMGCESGTVILWHITSKIYLSRINFHQSPVHALKFSLSPVQTRPISYTDIDNENGNVADTKYTPLILVSLAGQVCWWNISHLINNKRRSRFKQNGNGSRNILSPIGDLISASPIDFKTTKNPLLIGDCSGFTYDNNHQWEKMWNGKISKCNKKELLNCIKLRGAKGFKIIVNDDFSTFITIDQTGIIYIMNIIDNNNKTDNLILPIVDQRHIESSVDQVDGVMSTSIRRPNASI